MPVNRVVRKTTGMEFTPIRTICRSSSGDVVRRTGSPENDPPEHREEPAELFEQAQDPPADGLEELHHAALFAYTRVTRGPIPQRIS